MSAARKTDRDGTPKPQMRVFRFSHGTVPAHYQFGKYQTQRNKTK